MQGPAQEGHHQPAMPPPTPHTGQDTTPGLWWGTHASSLIPLKRGHALPEPPTTPSLLPLLSHHACRPQENPGAFCLHLIGDTEQHHLPHLCAAPPELAPPSHAPRPSPSLLTRQHLRAPPTYGMLHRATHARMHCAAETGQDCATPSCAKTQPQSVFAGGAWPAVLWYAYRNLAGRAQVRREKDNALTPAKQHEPPPPRLYTVPAALFHTGLHLHLLPPRALCAAAASCGTVDAPRCRCRRTRAGVAGLWGRQTWHAAHGQAPFSYTYRKKHARHCTPPPTRTPLPRGTAASARAPYPPPPHR